MTEKAKPGIKPGQWLGGIRNIADVKARCKVDYETDCWHWNGAKTGGKYPKISMKLNGHTQAFTGVKTSMLLIGKDVPEGMTVFHYKCNSIDCLNPDHLKIGTFKDKWAHIKEAGYLRGDPARAAANKAISMKRCKVAAHMDLILNSDKNSVELGKELGIHPSTIRAARSRGVGSAQVANASIFTWRPAA
jgi:hypothetical protein